MTSTSIPKTTDDAQELCVELLEAIESVVITEREFLETVLTGILSDGHVLLEDVPGTGKTLTAQLFAEALGLSFTRIQFTPDLLPTDITGSHIYNDQTSEFEFNEGPIFANIILADEINRAPPKTQAALLEAMGERQVTAGGTTRQLPEPFFVIATQNPVEQQGTFELPEAQRDRFMIKTSMGYPSDGDSVELLQRRAGRETSSESISAVLTPGHVTALQSLPETITVSSDLQEYMVSLISETRNHRSVRVGVSPRGLQRLFEAARGYSVLNGRDYVVPEDIKQVSRVVLPHRLLLTSQATMEGVTGADVIDEITSSTTVPGVVA